MELHPGQSLGETLDRFHMTQAQLARASGLQQHMISEFRSGKSDLKVSSLEKILRGLPTPARYYYLSLLGDFSEESEKLQKAS